MRPARQPGRPARLQYDGQSRSPFADLDNARWEWLQLLLSGALDHPPTDTEE